MKTRIVALAVLAGAVLAAGAPIKVRMDPPRQTGDPTPKAVAIAMPRLP